MRDRARVLAQDTEMQVGGGGGGGMVVPRWG